MKLKCHSQAETRKEAAMSKRKSCARYFNKVPPFTPDPEHYTRKQHTWKAKVAYKTEDDAWEFLNQKPELKAAGYKAYQCKTCQKWHVGKLRNNERKKAE